MEERQKLSVALQKAQDKYSRLQKQQLAESNFQLKHSNDTELRLHEKTRVLDETTKALHKLQREYADLGRRHGDINSDYRGLLKIHSALQVRHERLSYAQGNPRPEFSLPQFSAACV
ncbi:centrosomal protein of 152 kDa-like protein [Lates japonicus]|uniref:Centrosomal protein of 152 kDa-like protein n=1 Tax=Lates japonicus TaxID=270547 RepID=A0AAD3R9U1_LATJO|nr:centrosomal protein of 152 kDa-like protein [Lates japonicus]